jgi:hypothetical protein
MKGRSAEISSNNTLDFPTDPSQTLTEAIDFAVANETRAPRDLVMGHYETFGREPFGEAIGPIKDRGDPTGSSFATVTSWPNGVIRSAWTWPTV